MLPAAVPNSEASAPVLSACVIARDEEERLPDCLRSLAFCDEVVLVDSGSTDRTRELAAAAGARVVEHPWAGFGAQRNVALDHARGEWALEVDADERVSAELATAIRRYVAAPPSGSDIAALPCRDRFLGRTLGPSAKYPKYRFRLFRRGAYRHDEGRTVHEGLWPRTRAWPLDGDLEHLLAGSWAEALADARAYARLEAAQAAPPAGPAALVTAVAARPVAKVGYRLVVDGGWRDGWQGLAKIVLDAASDAGVALLAWRRRGRDARRAAGHYGRQAPSRPAGPAKVLALAASGPDAARAAGWLGELAGAGIDAVLLTPVPTGTPPAVRERRLAGRGPLAAIRALDAEEQLHRPDALVPVGPRARLVARLVPARLAGPHRVAPGVPAGAVLDRLRPGGTA